MLVAPLENGFQFFHTKIKVDDDMSDFTGWGRGVGKRIKREKMGSFSFQKGPKKEVVVFISGYEENRFCRVRHRCVHLHRGEMAGSLHEVAAKLLPGLFLRAAFYIQGA